MSRGARDPRERLLLLVSIGLAVLVATAGVATLREVFASRTRVAQLYARTQAQAVDAEHLLATSERVARFVRTSLLAPNPDTQRELAAARQDYWDTLERMRARAPGHGALFENVANDSERVQQVADALIAARVAGTVGPTLQQRYERELAPRRSRLEADTAALQQGLQEAFEKDLRTAEHLLDRSARLFLLGLGFGLCTLVGLLVLLLWSAGARRSALREAEQRAHAARLSEAKFSGIVRIASDAILSVDGAQRITIFNAGAEAIFGYRADEVLGRPLELLLPERHRAAHRAHVEAFAREELSARRMGERGEVCGLRRNGEEFPAEAAISRLQVDGELLMTVVLRDVTEQRRTEREQRYLAAAGAELGESLDPSRILERLVHLAVPELAACCIVCLADEVGPGLASAAHRDPARSRWLQEQLRARPEEAARCLARVIHSAQPELHPTLAPAAPGSREPDLFTQLHCHSAVLVPLRAHGRSIGALALLQVAAAARRFDERDLLLAGELAHRASLAIDNARLYSDAQRATQARDEVLGIVAHDLRNPLQTLMAAIRLLERKLAKQRPALEATAHESVERVLRSARRMDRLIEDLLDVVRLESGTLAVSPALQSAAHLAEETVAAMSESARDAQLELELDLRGPLGDVRVDADRIQQVLGNLVGNALKFTPAGGRVTVGAAPRQSDLLFWVADTGPGIPAEQLGHLFDRFWQARPMDRRGAGLGLSIAKGLVEAHGGHIWAESTPGAGSCFFFTLPRPAPAARDLELPHAAG